MDDGRLPGEMSLENIAKDLTAIKEQIDKQFSSIDKRFDGIEAEMRSGFTRVGEELNKAKIRDEELHGLLKFSLEAREGLRESMEQRFDEVRKKQDQDIDLVKNVLRHVTGTRASS